MTLTLSSMKEAFRSTTCIFAECLRGEVIEIPSRTLSLCLSIKSNSFSTAAFLVRIRIVHSVSANRAQAFSAQPILLGGRTPSVDSGAKLDETPLPLVFGIVGDLGGDIRIDHRIPCSNELLPIREKTVWVLSIAPVLQ